MRRRPSTIDRRSAMLDAPAAASPLPLSAPTSPRAARRAQHALSRQRSIRTGRRHARVGDAPHQDELPPGRSRPAALARPARHQVPVRRLRHQGAPPGRARHPQATRHRRARHRLPRAAQGAAQGARRARSPLRRHLDQAARLRDGRVRGASPAQPGRGRRAGPSGRS